MKAIPVTYSQTQTRTYARTHARTHAPHTQTRTHAHPNFCTCKVKTVSLFANGEGVAPLI